MKGDYFNAHNKYMIIKHALDHHNITYTCQLFGISRTTFYKWYKAYKAKGREGLKPITPQKPKMPNKTPAYLVDAILDYVKDNPLDGPKRIRYGLMSQGYLIGESAIFNVLKRQGLSHKKDRVHYSKTQYIRKKASVQLPECLKKNQLSKAKIGSHLVQKIDYLGYYKGLGKVYQYLVLDIYSNWVMVKLFQNKGSFDPWDHFELKLSYLMKTLQIEPHNLITLKTQESLGCFFANQRYLKLMDHYGIDHVLLDEDQYQLLPVFKPIDARLNAFYQTNLREDRPLGFRTLERQLEKEIRRYNFSRSEAESLGGRPFPGEFILEHINTSFESKASLPLWLQALLNESEVKGHEV